MNKQDLINAGLAQGVDLIEEGELSALDEYVKAKNEITRLEAYAQALHDAALDEFENFGEKEANIKGRTIKKGEYGTKYDYTNCNHKHTQILEMEAKGAKTKLDVHYKLLKALTSKMDFFDEDTGEVFTVTPPTKTSTTKITVT